MSDRFLISLNNELNGFRICEVDFFTKECLNLGKAREDVFLNYLQTGFMRELNLNIGFWCFLSNERKI